jgi:hypothetical protein
VVAPEFNRFLRPPEQACLHRCPAWPLCLALPHSLAALAALAWQGRGTARSTHLLPLF